MLLFQLFVAQMLRTTPRQVNETATTKKTNDVLNSCARCCGQEEQWTPQALQLGGNRSRSTLSAPSGPFQTKSNTAHIASALPQMHRSDKRANFGSCKIKKWTSQRGPRRFFLSSLPLLSPATTAVLGSYMSFFYSQLTLCRPCGFAYLYGSHGSQKEDDRGSLRIQSSLVQAVKHCIKYAMI
jgi:hypothetical protein